MEQESGHRRGYRKNSQGLEHLECPQNAICSVRDKNIQSEASRPVEINHPKVPKLSPEAWLRGWTDETRRGKDIKGLQKEFQMGVKEKEVLGPGSGSLSSLIKCLSSTLNRDWKEPGFALLNSLGKASPAKGLQF